MKMYYAKVVVFVDDELCDRELFDLIPVLSSQVNVNGEYIEREFGIHVRVLWSSLTDATHTLTDEEMQTVKSMFRNHPEKGDGQ